ncbi:SymE family type I addiction module toxin [Undibacterium aquatile]|uniref:Type I toxin-antitoxin system SymE family toxin n=2 Tax=Undibacterium aquatile TaxID=1537398 RepID=A0ABR6XBK4_9BURK|nr:type I toxin-antitoxin system SymE family toxin [Undibacterium aquatile]
MAMLEQELSTEAAKTKIRRFRFLTVSLYPESRPCRPFIRLCGHWLRDAGFLPQMKVRVEVEHGRIVITADSASK